LAKINGLKGTKFIGNSSPPDMLSLVATVTRAEAHKEAHNPAKEGGVSMRRIAILLAAIVAGVLVSTGVVMAASSSGSQQQTSSNKEGPSLSVMTRNVYHGVNAEIAQAAAAPTFDEFKKAATAVYFGYHERKFPERAAVLAAEIAETQPDVVGLQEAVIVQTTPAPTPAPLGDLDYLQILLKALEARGLHYKVAVEKINWDISVPTSQGFILRHTDRIAMLIRTDGKAGLEVLGTNSGHFQKNCTLHTGAVGDITILRGWTSVDLSVQGKAVRLINTHLDGDCSDPAINLAQAQEILQGPVQDARAKNLPVILLGDLNSKADGTGTQTYAELLKVGFADAWAEEGRDPVTHPELGYTCCQDANLLNEGSHLSDRRDFVLFLSGALQATDAEVVGANPADRTPSGLWPSDHAGVVADLRLLSK
jgi:endonuclease/exonuclease/phosphatase family metal-dependent hydrolase